MKAVPVDATALPETSDQAKQLWRRLRSAAGWSTVVKVLAFGLNFTIGIVLARLLSAHGFGIYSNAIAWYELLVVPASLGLNQLLVREVAVGLANGHVRQARSALRLGQLLVAGALLVIIAAGSLIAFRIWGESDRSIAVATTAALAIALPLGVFTQIRQAVLRGLHMVALSLVPEMLVRPVILLATIVIVALATGTVDPLTAVLIFGFATGAALFYAEVVTRRGFAKQPDDASPGNPISMKSLLKSAVPLILLGGVQTAGAKIGTIILGAFHPPTIVGIYSASFRLADTITFAQTTINLALGPMIATLYARQQHSQLQNIIRRTALLNGAFALAAAAMMFSAAAPLLGLFGDKFVAGAPLLRILTLGRVVSACAGPVGIILIMTGRETIAARGIAIGALTGIGVSVLLIPTYGGYGAAVASSVGLIVWNTVLARAVWKHLGINPSVLTFLKRARS